jgi:cytochrome b561
MRWMNGEHGYGLVTKTLHWLTFLVVAAQFAVGWTMDTEDDAGRERFDRAEDACEATVDSDAAEAEEERCEEEVDREEDAFEEANEDRPSDLHIALGVGILVLASLRVLWRAYTPLPPWSERYGEVGRRIQWALEKALLTLLFVVPVSGLLLHRGEAALAVHVAAQILFLAAIGVHVAMQVGYRHVRRMLV